MEPKIKIAYVDDHAMVRQLMLNFLNDFNLFECIAQASQGDVFIELLRQSPVKPDVCIIDINLGGNSMNGYEVADLVKKEFKQTKILAVTSQDSEFSVLKMVQNGATGYILKDEKPEIVKEAIVSIHQKGYYANEIATSRLLLNSESQKRNQVQHITDKELEFIKWNCSDLSYKEIGEKMEVGVRAVEYYRNSLYEKIGIKTRVDLAIFAMKNGLDVKFDG